MLKHIFPLNHNNDMKRNLCSCYDGFHGSLFFFMGVGVGKWMEGVGREQFGGFEDFVCLYLTG